MDLQAITILLVCIVIDLIGFASYLIPGMGEISDTVWAPLSSAILYGIFGSGVGASINFVEEILPFTDICPTATLLYFYYYHWAKKEQEGKEKNEDKKKKKKKE